MVQTVKGERKNHRVNRGFRVRPVYILRALYPAYGFVACEAKKTCNCFVYGHPEYFNTRFTGSKSVCLAGHSGHHNVAMQYFILFCNQEVIGHPCWPNCPTQGAVKAVHIEHFLSLLFSRVCWSWPNYFYQRCGAVIIIVNIESRRCSFFTVLFSLRGASGHPLAKQCARTGLGCLYNGHT